MKILLIDTCGETGSIALADTAPMSQIREVHVPGRSAAEQLLAAVRVLLADVGFPLKAINLIAVVHGPGSFTGIRVAVSAAKGLSEALAVPLIAISRLAVLTGTCLPGGFKRTTAVLDAGRGEFYCGVYEGTTCVRETLATTSELQDLFAGSNKIIVCENAVRRALEEWTPQMVDAPAMAAALAIAVRRAVSADFDDIASVDANYVRRTAAEIFSRPSTPQVRL